MIEHLMRQ